MMAGGGRGTWSTVGCSGSPIDDLPSEVMGIGGNEYADIEHDLEEPLESNQLEVDGD